MPAGRLQLLRSARRVHPAAVIGAGLALTLFNSNWGYLGVPGGIAPDRILLLLGTLMLLAGVNGSSDRPRLRILPVHIAMIVALAYATGSALFSSTLTASTGLFGLIDHFGLLPFVMFAIAPMAFSNAQRRSWLLAGMIVVGTYLSLTTIFEVIGPHSLVFPRYINNPVLGIHFGRGRGPFLEAAVNGVMLFSCGIGAAIAAYTWRRLWPRRIAVAVSILCVLSVLLTLQRSAWIGGGVALAVTMVLVPSMRRYVIPTALLVTIAVGGAVAFIPGLDAKVKARGDQQETVWQRDNLLLAAKNMVLAKPLFGVGWDRFTAVSADYWEQSPNYPLDTVPNLIVHNVYASYAAELGLVGLLLWAGTVILGIGSAVITRGPPELAPWRVGLIAIATMWLVSSIFTPMLYLAPNVLVWLWAGIVFGGRQFEPPPPVPQRVAIAGAPTGATV